VKATLDLIGRRKMAPGNRSPREKTKGRKPANAGSSFHKMRTSKTEPQNTQKGKWEKIQTTEKKTGRNL